MGIKDSIEETEDDRALQSFYSTVEIKENRVCVTWPYRMPNPELPDNWQLALGRLKSVRQRLDAELLAKYDTIIRDQEQKGIIERIPTIPSFTAPPKEGKLTHYVPHHAVLTPQKTTTKVRMVFDCSAKTKKSNLSLNECLYCKTPWISPRAYTKISRPQ